MNERIFKAYDVRGKYPEELNEEAAYLIGRAFVQHTSTKDVLVGHDSRTHSPDLAQALMRGLTEQGARVTFCGLATTPQVIAMHGWKAHDTAIMVTASHLEAPFNGFKLYARGGRPLNRRAGMSELQTLAKQAEFPAVAHGYIQQVNYTTEYAQRVRNLQPVSATVPFVVDCSNGAVGPEMELHCAALQLPIQLLNSTPDGTFPVHSPDPLASNVHEFMRTAIYRAQAAGGAVFDADADRIVFFDETGTIIPPNLVSCLLIERLLREQPGRTIAHDLISSQIVPDTIRKAGGKALRTVVGRNVMVDDMREHDALFGAEVSSHMVYQDMHYADASTRSLLLVLDILTQSGSTFSALVAPYKQYTALERNYTVPDADAALQALQNEFTQAQTDFLDGITFTFPDGSWLVARRSNTEPIVRLRGESTIRENIEKYFTAAEQCFLRLGATIAKH